MIQSVVHLIDTGGPGGAERLLADISISLSAEGLHGSAVIGHAGWLAEHLVRNGIPTSIIPGTGSLNVRYLLDLLRELRRRKADALVAHLYGPAVYGSLAGVVSRIPTIVVIHGQTDVASDGRLAGLKSAIVRLGARRVVFVSTALRRALQPVLRLRDDACMVIENGVDLEQFRPMPDTTLRETMTLGPSAILVGAIGNIRAPKDYGNLLQAARLLRDRSDAYHFAVAGEGSGPLYEMLLEARERLGLEDCFHFLGLRSDIPRILNNLDVFVLGSSTEGFSLSCVEAMACGIPVVATRSGGPETIVEDGVSGLLIPARSPSAIAGAVQRLVEDKALRQHLSVNGLVRARSAFSRGAMLTRYRDLVRSVTGN